MLTSNISSSSVSNVGLQTGYVPKPQTSTDTNSTPVNPIDTIQDTVSLSSAATDYLRSLLNPANTTSSTGDVSQDTVNDVKSIAAENLSTIAYLNVAESEYQYEQSLYAPDSNSNGTQDPYYNPDIAAITNAAGAATSAESIIEVAYNTEATNTPTYRPTPEPAPTPDPVLNGSGTANTGTATGLGTESPSGDVTQQTVDDIRGIAVENAQTVAYLNAAEAAYQAAQSLYTPSDNGTQDPYYNPDIATITRAAGAATAAESLVDVAYNPQAANNTSTPAPEPTPAPTTGAVSSERFPGIIFLP